MTIDIFKGEKMSTWIITDELSHYGVKGMKWGVRKEPASMPGQKGGSKHFNISGKAVGKTFKANEAVERKKSQVASKLGAKVHAQKYKNNADYYKKTANDLASGKVGKPKTNYQKAMRWLGKTNFATKAIISNSGPVKLTKQQQAQALVEQHQMRKADGWYKKKAKRLAAIKVANLAVGAALSK